MERRHGLRRPFVALAALSLLLITGRAALGALPAPSVSASPELTPPLVGRIQPSPDPDGPAAVFARSRTEPTEAEKRAPQPHLLAAIERAMPITAKPGGGAVVGQMPAGSKYFGTGLKAWVLERTEDGRFGRVTVPYSGSNATGWIRLAGLQLSSTPYSVEADLSEHAIVVKNLDKTVLRISAATGATDSPTPPGRYFVTDMVPFEDMSYFGSFAFGISGIQTNLPEGWTGGDQLAIHGTNDPASIGQSSSAGCLRVSEDSLTKLKRTLQLGTPVTIQP